MKIGDNVYVHGHVDEIRNGTVIIRNEGGYFGTVPSEIIVANKQPTVDAVPVVRCKDCKYLSIINKAPLYAYCGKNNYIFHLWEDNTREHFCSWGEKRENDTNRP